MYHMTRQKEALDFLNWAEQNIGDWLILKTRFENIEINTTDAMEILELSLEHGFLNLFFIILMAVGEDFAMPTARDSLIIKLMAKDIQMNGIEAFMAEFKEIVKDKKQLVQNHSKSMDW